MFVFLLTQVALDALLLGDPVDLDERRVADVGQHVRQNAGAGRPGRWEENK